MWNINKDVLKNSNTLENCIPPPIYYKKYYIYRYTVVPPLIRPLRPKATSIIRYMLFFRNTGIVKYFLIAPLQREATPLIRNIVYCWREGLIRRGLLLYYFYFYGEKIVLILHVHSREAIPLTLLVTFPLQKGGPYRRMITVFLWGFFMRRVCADLHVHSREAIPLTRLLFHCRSGDLIRGWPYCL